MSTRVLIVGSGGQLGVELVREFTARSWEVVGLKRAELDITDQAKVEQAIAAIDPGVVINAAAYNHVDLAEKQPVEAFQANAIAVRNLALACRQSDARFVQFSTDYVFDGTKGSSYVEDDRPHPMGAYAVSKYAGELYAQAYLESPLIIRTSGVFGPGGLHTARGNFIESMLRLAKSGQPLRVVQSHVASPTYSPLLAARSADLVAANASGVFHAGGGTAISWYDFAAMIFQAAGLTPELRVADEREYRTAAKRPRYSALSNSKLEAFGVKPFPPMEEVVRDYLAKRTAITAAV
ncbi:MAG: dTDP-4-dehydrorhamnose reductase [Candidatus Solibacter usitatus]|nr:dTDP-4-dehydrorhamnose reductase [Candidatus Solibacter usitatus]